MAIPHKWAKEIKAWADGAEIETRVSSRGEWQRAWNLVNHPVWNTGSNVEYRVKPVPAVVERTYHAATDGVWYPSPGRPFNLKLFFEDGKLVKAEIL